MINFPQKVEKQAVYIIQHYFKKAIFSHGKRINIYSVAWNTLKPENVVAAVPIGILIPQ
jgi:hypothetical protein